MYLRFCTYIPCPEAPGAFDGLFCAAYDLRDSGETPAWLADAINHHIQWFNRELPKPARLGVKSRGVVGWQGVCWFKPQATECIDRARDLVALVQEGGVAIKCLKRRDPGEILYEDDFQVVAKAARSQRPPRKRLVIG